jgi:hypothetical protein
MAMRPADVSALRMLRRARDRIAYGVEAIMRDDSGNWYSFTQHKFLGD